jgi:hypothetical protein
MDIKTIINSEAWRFVKDLLRKELIDLKDIEKINECTEVEIKARLLAYFKLKIIINKLTDFEDTLEFSKDDFTNL